MAHEWWGSWDCIYPSLVYVSLKEFGVVGLDMYTWGIKDFDKCWSGSLAKRRLCLGPASVINFTLLTALPFWVSLFPGMHGYNKTTAALICQGTLPPSFYPSKNFFFIFTAFILSFFISLFICSEFCHTLEWNSHGFTCVPHPDPPSHLPPHPLPLGFPSAPGPRACLMHPTWAGDLFHPRYYTCFDAVLLKHPTLSSHRV